MRHLQTFVGIGYGEHADALWVYGIGEFLKRAKHFLFCDDDDLLGLADEPAVGGLLELFTGIDGGHDDSDIFLGDVSRVFGERDRAVCEGCNDTDAVPQVSIEPKDEEGQFCQLVAE